MKKEKEYLYIHPFYALDTCYSLIFIGAIIWGLIAYIIKHIFNYESTILSVTLSILFTFLMVYFGYDTAKLYNDRIEMFRLYKKEARKTINIDKITLAEYRDVSRCGDVDCIITYFDNDKSKKVSLPLSERKMGKKVIRYLEDKGIEVNIEINPSDTYYDEFRK